MNYRIKIDGHEFHVEVGALDQAPVTVTVDGEPFQVWVESDSIKALPAEAVPRTLPRVETTAAAPARTSNTHQIVAPIPGVILTIAVKPGERVEYGQELFVLETMKMKSCIRAPRAGQVGTIHVAAGQTVKYRQVLLEFAD
jgi:biotin carboxyl carrier protein